MKLRRGFPSQQLLFLLLSLVGFLGRGLAEDEVVTRDGKVTYTKVLGVVGDSVEIRVGAGTIGVPLANVSRVVKDPPTAFHMAVRAYKNGELKKALIGALAVADRWAGLPTPWAQQATGMLGDIYLELGNEKGAEAAYKFFKRKYPGKASLQGDVGMARLAVSKGEWGKAKKLVEPIIEAALKDPQPSETEGLAYSQAFYVSGQIMEHKDDLAGALQDYLRTVTIFNEDSIAVSSALARADELRKEHDVVVP